MPRFWLPFPLAHIVVFVAMCVLSIPIYVVSPFDRRKVVVDAIARVWMRLILFVTGIRVPPELTDDVPGDGPYIFMANHQSHMDVVLLLATLPRSPKFVAKRELLWVPVFGLTMLALGHITIDRRNRERAIRSLDEAGRKIREGVNVLVFPEGTRTLGDPDYVGPFKKGGFMLALKAGVPIVPIGIAGTADRMKKAEFRVKPGVVCYRIGEPIPTAGLTEADRDALMEQVRAAIAELKLRAWNDLKAWEQQHGVNT
ncbi:MAG: 1-acyl-sn-glycerol-3-phosphate acyltransferase [Candidatus Dadabacteria bacterium]|nr:MAG: 1-acyl-sn-glycerol-3-phosphate acyltransferase [Candidatus Dadabacteria bacterium]